MSVMRELVMSYESAGAVLDEGAKPTEVFVVMFVVRLARRGARYEVCEVTGVPCVNQYGTRGWLLGPPYDGFCAEEHVCLERKDAELSRELAEAEYNAFCGGT